MIPGDYGKFEHERAYKANKRTGMFDAKSIHERKYLCSTLTLLCYNHEAHNNLHHLSCQNRQNELKLTNTPSRVICFR